MKRNDAEQIGEMDSEILPAECFGGATERVSSDTGMERCGGTCHY